MRSFQEFAERVEGLARPKVFIQGRALHTFRRVTVNEASPERVQGTVQDSAASPYEVVLQIVPVLRTGTLVCTCRCNANLCRHGVALLLAAATHPGTARSLPEPSAVGQPTSRSLRARMPAAELARVVSELGVADYAERRLAAALGGSALPAVASRWMYGYSHLEFRVGDLLLETLPTRPGYRTLPAPPPELTEAARRYLDKHATRLAAARAREQAFLTSLRPPADPRLQGAYASLLAGRARWRPGCECVPNLPAQRVQVDPDPPTLRLTLPGDACALHRDSAVFSVRFGDPAAPAPLESASPGELEVCCDFGCPYLGACELRLAAIDAALRLLSAPEPTKETEALAVALSTPVWERLLERLTGALASSCQAPGLQADGEPAKVGWRLTPPLLNRLGYSFRLDPVLARVKKTGPGYVLRNAAVAELLAAEGPTDADRALLARLELSDGPRGLQDGHAARAMAQLVGHPLVFLQQPGGARSVSVRRSALTLEVAATAEGGARLSLGVDGQGAVPAELLEALPELQRRGIPLLLGDEAHTQLRVIELTPALAAVAQALVRRDAPIPVEALPRLLGPLAEAGARLPLRLDEQLAGEALPTDPTVRVRLTRLPGEGLAAELVVQPLAELPSYPPGEGPQTAYLRRDAALAHARRELEQERQTAELLEARLGLSEAPRSGPFAYTLQELEPALALLEALAVGAPDDPPVCWADQRRYRLTRSATAADLRVQVADRRGWFGLGGEVQLDEAVVPLGELLRALREKRTYVLAGQDTYVRLSEALRRDLGAVATLASAKGKAGPELSPFATPLLDSLLSAGARVEGAGEFTRTLARLREAETLQPAVPATLRGELRSYQQEGFVWMCRLAHWGAGACLADDMGLGKTIQALALLLQRAALGPALVVAPTSVVHNWQREAARFAPSLRLRPVRSGAELLALGEPVAGEVLVTSYGLLTRHAARLAEVRFATLVLDEAQAVKNVATDRARAAASLQAEARVALTGTPIENRTGELYSLFSILLPGLLGSAESFRERFAGPIERDRDELARQRLATLIRPFVLRRLKEQVAPELPARTEIRRDVELSRAERARYDQLRTASLAALANPAAAGGDENTRRFQLLAALTRLRQLACHPRLVDPAAPPESAKLAALRELVAELVAEGHRALIFSQFTEHLALVRAALDEDGVRWRYLDGSTPAARRKTEIDAFQAGDGQVFLLSLKAGGTGINLTAADYVVFLDPWWNPAVEAQAADRAHRIGQDKPVTIVRLVARDTIEEGILGLQAEKRELVSALLDGTGSGAALSGAELLALIESSGSWSDAGADEDELEGEARTHTPAPAAARTVAGGLLGEGRAASKRAKAKGGAGPAPAPARASKTAAPVSLPPTVAPASPAPTAAPASSAATTAPAGPSPAAAPTPTHQLLLAGLDVVLEQAIEAGALGRPSAHTYRRVASRFVELSLGFGWSLVGEALPATVASYVRDVKAGRIPGAPPSDATMVKSLGRWLELAAVETGAGAAAGAAADSRN